MEYSKLHSGDIYNPADSKIIKEQQSYMDKLYEFNHAHPTEKSKKRQLLTEMLADFGKDSHIEPPFHANWGGHHVHVGNNVYANVNLTVVDDTYIYIGDHVMLGPNVVLSTGSHPISPQLRKRGLQYNLPIYIEDNVWIGSGVQVLPGVRIGKNTVIGSGSVVTKNIPANVVAVGNPCRIIREITENKEENET